MCEGTFTHVYMPVYMSCIGVSERPQYSYSVYSVWAQPVCTYPAACPSSPPPVPVCCSCSNRLSWASAAFTLCLLLLFPLLSDFILSLRHRQELHVSGKFLIPALLNWLSWFVCRKCKLILILVCQIKLNPSPLHKVCSVFQSEAELFSDNLLFAFGFISAFQL